MRIITRRRIGEWSKAYPTAANWLMGWVQVVRRSRWEGLADVRQVFPATDAVKVDSGRTVHIFNVRGNRYRMIVAIHFDAGRVYMLRLMTHAEYDKEDWKRTL